MNSGPSADQSGNSFVGDHTNGGGIFNNANEAHETLRNRLDGSQWERVQRSRDLRSRPQPLTGDERQVLRETVAPLLRDLVATGMSLPDIREEAHADSGVEAVHAWIKDSDRAGTSIQIWMSVPPVARVVMLAEQIQEWAGDRLHDAGRPAAWPGCCLLYT